MTRSLFSADSRSPLASLVYVHEVLELSSTDVVDVTDLEGLAEVGSLSIETLR